MAMRKAPVGMLDLGEQWMKRKRSIRCRLLCLCILPVSHNVVVTRRPGLRAGYTVSRATKEIGPCNPGIRIAHESRTEWIKLVAKSDHNYDIIVVDLDLLLEKRFEQ